MSEYCSFLLNRFEVGTDGKTAYERMEGKKAKQQGLEFCEGVLFKRKRANQRKDDSVWDDGVYLGVRGISGEIIVGTKEGVWKTRTVRRKPVEHRWCQSNVDMIGGVPWNSNGGAGDEEPDGDLPSEVIKLEARRVGEAEAEKIKESIEVPRSFSISRADLEKYGFTSKCGGCRCVMRGSGRQPHTAECRERLRSEMSGDQKVKDAKEREMEFHEKVYEDMKTKIQKKQEDQVREVDEAEEERKLKKSRKEVDAPIVEGGNSRSSSDPEGSLRARHEDDEGDGETPKPTAGEHLPPQLVSPNEVKRRRKNLDNFEDDEDEDIDIGWVEFAMTINGVEMLKDVNVEELVDTRTEIAVMEAFDDVTGLELDVRKLKAAREEEITYIETIAFGRGSL